MRLFALLAGCAAVWGWDGEAQRQMIFDEKGVVLTEYRQEQLLVLVWRQGLYHYHKWICNTGYYHNCFDGYTVDQVARTCGVSHEGPEQIVDCDGLRRDPDLAPYINW